MKKKLRFFCIALAACVALTALAGLGVLDQADAKLSDLLCQRPAARDGQIVVVGIDEAALERYGPFQQWSRHILAEALETLNQSEDCRPAVIGVDILFSGPSADPAADARLAQAAGAYGNVVCGCAAHYGTELVADGGDYALDTFAVLGLDRPYDALAQRAMLGHINAMLDSDGILRHYLLFVELPDGTELPSLGLAVANRYRAARGEDPVRQPPVSRQGFWYLPFSGGAGSIEYVSLAELLSGGVLPDFFDGKIVLIGPYAPGLQDSYFTAIDHVRLMNGVEIHANAVQAMLWEDYRTQVGDGLQLAVLLAVLLGAAYGFWRRKVRWSTALWLLLCAGWPLLCRAAYDQGWVLRVLWVPAGATVLYAGCLAGNYIQAALERRQVTDTFQRYVAPEIVRELLQAGPAALELGGRQTEIAVLFVDVRGFTTMSEQLEPKLVVEILNRYLTLISQCIFRHGGTLDKFVGDAAMAFWGAPLPQEDAVMHAVRAAADMAAGSRALSAELEARYGRAVSFGIGVHVGPAVVGNIGSPQRMDYTAIGDTVNTAARLEANAPGGTIYISRAVADALEGRIRATSLGGSVRLKGKQAGFEVLTLDAILDAPSALDQEAASVKIDTQGR